MQKDIYDPLREYVNVYRHKFKEVAEKTFAELAAEAQVDVEKNRETCRRIYSEENSLSKVMTSIRWQKVWRVLLWLCVAVGFIVGFTMYDVLDYVDLLIVGFVIFGALGLLFTDINPKIKEMKSERDKLTAKVDKLKKEAWQQMAPLNNLYDWDVLTRMMTKTVPRLEFDPYFTTQRLSDLKATYGWSDSFNAGRSVVYSHSGLINGNPFVICRTRKMEMGTKTYYGEKTIHWTTEETDSDGKTRTVHHSETLVASVTAPYPEYFEKTRLIYGNTAAPDLIFYRKQSGLADSEGSLKFKMKRHSLRKKSRDLSNADFAMMTNEEFEVAFDTSNRNNNQQYALLFTPLAQESMMNLLKDDKVGFGDDFDFGKQRMINVIFSKHMQSLNLDMNPQQYKGFDYDKAEADFYAINSRYFRAIYFCFAPLLCVPMYQQIRPQEDIYGRNMQQHSSFWEHEALANFWGQGRFKHPSCVTNCILKTEQLQTIGDNSTIKVNAYGYRTEQHLEYVSKWGGDGHLHHVPVYWDEYLPVTGSGMIYLKEDNNFKDDSLTQRQRLGHIHSVLTENNLNIYRRHIASRV